MRESTKITEVLGTKRADGGLVLAPVISGYVMFRSANAVGMIGPLA